MSIRTIPVEPAAHLSFRVTLNDVQVKLRINWLTRFKYFVYDLDADGERIISGRGLHRGLNLLEGTSVNGRLFVDGISPNPNTLGRESVLKYETPDG